jgi:hypothetical protein
LRAHPDLGRDRRDRPAGVDHQMSGLTPILRRVRAFFFVVPIEDILPGGSDDGDEGDLRDFSEDLAGRCWGR